ncbi:hypothetical protein P154DRAFT_572555 [Amniculicola lignicola CBS 123094]|uniref:Uncharacterized protein n=1 Tax=Amniculicola lignicola CBS 123094 TaxID=1392246 RepID=A0A6A5WT21_9PLEO|nr:hypothetical protein P154DRAFT_572555 [Amniculicola lignicola CBS 123094]
MPCPGLPLVQPPCAQIHSLNGTFLVLLPLALPIGTAAPPVRPAGWPASAWGTQPVMHDFGGRENPPRRPAPARGPRRSMIGGASVMEPGRCMAVSAVGPGLDYAPTAHGKQHRAPRSLARRPPLLRGQPVEHRAFGVQQKRCQRRRELLARD